MSNPSARLAANLPVANPSPHQAQSSANGLNPGQSNGPAIFAATQAAYLADAMNPRTAFNSEPGEIGEPRETDGPLEAA